MKRRDFIRATAVASVAMGAGVRGATEGALLVKRVRPGEKGWPLETEWSALQKLVGGRLRVVEAPDAAELQRELKNPFYIGDQPGLTQTSGWVDAWRSARSAYVVAAESSEDVVAAVKFARLHNLRLVVKGGGHSYKGTSNCADSLLIWTRKMRRVEVMESFVPQGAPAGYAGQPAVTVGAGAIWMDAYDAVTTRAGRYVQGGGCTSVGVAGLVQSGGFGSFSKNYGTASAGLVEVEIVTADGVVRVANAFQERDLFWAIKGGGGGSLGVLTRLTLRTRELPEFFGAVFGMVKASSAAAYRRLVTEVVRFYGKALFNRHWGEQIEFKRRFVVDFSMVFQGLDKAEAERVWRPMVEWIRAGGADYTWEEEIGVAEIPAREFWNVEFWKKNLPQAIVLDGRAGASDRKFLWEGDRGQVGFFLHAYRSVWLPQGLLKEDKQAGLVDALVASSQIWNLSLHFNKGLAGGAPEAIAGARETAMNPEVLDAFALVIIAAAGAPAYSGLPGAEPDVAKGRREAELVDRSMAELLKVTSARGSYVSESDYFEKAWQKSFWGTNHARLAEVKRKYDPEGLFFVHQGIGTEGWSRDGFEKRAGA